MNHHKKRDTYKVVAENKKENMKLRRLVFDKNLNFPDGIVLELKTTKVKP